MHVRSFVWLVTCSLTGDSDARAGLPCQPWRPVGVLLVAAVTEWVTNNDSLFTWPAAGSGSRCVCGEVGPLIINTVAFLWLFLLSLSSLRVARFHLQSIVNKRSG